MRFFPSSHVHLLLGNGMNYYLLKAEYKYVRCDMRLGVGSNKSSAVVLSISSVPIEPGRCLNCVERTKPLLSD